MGAGRHIFGFRDDLDLDSRWWHRLAKVAFFLVFASWFLWMALQFPPEHPSGAGYVRPVETLAEFAKAHPDLPDATEAFVQKYKYQNGKLQADGSYGYAFFESTVYCAGKPYEHPEALARYLRPIDVGRQPIAEDGLKVLRDLKVQNPDPDGYVCVYLASDAPSAEDIVGWEHTALAKAVGYSQKYALIALVVAVGAVFVLNAYYRAFVYIVCGPRKKLPAAV